jgi:hypothetical protein
MNTRLTGRKSRYSLKYRIVRKLHIQEATSNLPQRHSKMRLIGKWQRSVPNAFQVTHGVLKHRHVVGHACGNGGLHKALLHQI